MTKLAIKLFEEIRKDIKIQIYGKISEEGKLIIEGIDSGELVKKLKGDWVYEYHLTVSRSNKELLINRLQNKNINISNDEELLNWLQKNYSQNNVYSTFKAFLTTEDIDFEIFIW